MLEHVDSYIKSRLQLVNFNYPTAGVGGVPAGYRPMTVYGYEPSREKGETEFPSLVLIRQHVEMRQLDQRIDHEVFIPGDTTVTVEVPMYMGGGSETGVVGFTRKPYPIPIDIYYQVDTLATDELIHSWLTEMLLQLFPVGFQAEIPNLSFKQYASFGIQRVLGIDDLDKPVFRSTYALGVFDLWLDRVEHYTTPSIQTIEFESEVVES